MRYSRPRVALFGAFMVLTGAAAFLPQAAVSQTSQGTPVVQALPNRDSLKLSSALSRLARNPKDVNALVDAGNSASAMGDNDAAIGFFKRAQQIKPNDPRVLSGLAGALVQHAEPAAALPLFAQAERAGADPASIAADRGLAYDLTGDPVSAQRYYQTALAAGSDQEVSRRLAVSYAISGDERGMERVLLPLLQDQDKAAWRTRAFGLAILGKSKEAIKIARTLLPAKVADSISPYLEYMPRLTKAQQAAAANLGVFPRASEIGRDRAAIAAAGGSPQAAAGSAANADRPLVPAGKPLGQPAAQRPVSTASPAELSRAKEREMKDAQRRAKQEAQLAARQSKVPPPEPKPTIQQGPASEPAFSNVSPPAVPPVAEIMEGKKVAQAELPPVATPKAAPAPAATPKPVATSPVPAAPRAAESPKPVPPAAEVARPVVQSTPATASATASVSTPPSPAPGFDLANVPASTPSGPETVQPLARPQEADVDFGSMFADLGRPQASAAPAAGAVDIRKIEPARPKPAPPPPPPPPAHPSRIWVQLGIGQKESALAYDWKRIERGEGAALLKGRKAYTAKLNRTNRLLVGPFESQKAAQKFIDDLEKAGIDGPYIWTSPAGEVVDAL